MVSSVLLCSYPLKMHSSYFCISAMLPITSGVCGKIQNREIDILGEESELLTWAPVLLRCSPVLLTAFISISPAPPWTRSPTRTELTESGHSTVRRELSIQ